MLTYAKKRKEKKRKEKKRYIADFDFFNQKGMILTAKNIY